MLIILGLLLQAVVAPLVLIGTVILSFGAAVGLSALAFRHIFGFPGADNSMPLFAFVFLVALGIDYNIFLMTRVREELAQVRDAPRDAGRAGRHRRRDHRGRPGAGGHVRHALPPSPWSSSRRSGSRWRSGVLLDTLVVRSVLVTALTLDIGGHPWWPSPLAARRDDDVAATPPRRADPRPVNRTGRS